MKGRCKREKRKPSREGVDAGAEERMHSMESFPQSESRIVEASGNGREGGGINAVGRRARSMDLPGPYQECATKDGSEDIRGGEPDIVRNEVSQTHHLDPRDLETAVGSGRNGEVEQPDSFTPAISIPQSAKLRYFSHYL
jgi:hypothetical protein